MKLGCNLGCLNVSKLRRLAVPTPVSQHPRGLPDPVSYATINGIVSRTRGRIVAARDGRGGCNGRGYLDGHRDQPKEPGTSSPMLPE